MRGLVAAGEHAGFSEEAEKGGLARWPQMACCPFSGFEGVRDRKKKKKKKHASERYEEGKERTGCRYDPL